MILKDYLLGLFVIMMMFPLIRIPLEMTLNLPVDSSELNDLLGIEKLRRELILADIETVDDKYVIFESKGEKRKLIYDDRRLYLTPGYQLFLADIDTLIFRMDGGILCLVYQKDRKNETIPIR